MFLVLLDAHHSGYMLLHPFSNFFSLLSCVSANSWSNSFYESQNVLVGDINLPLKYTGKRRWEPNSVIDLSVCPG